MTQQVEVAVVGAGFAGIGMGIELERRGVPYVVLERGDRVGGVWRDNTYPGAACDIPSHLYSFSFEPRADWARKYATQPEIREYVEHCARKYGVLPHVRLGTEVTGAAFDEDTALWTVTTATGAEVVARFLVMATGQLGRPAYPRIPGIDSFRGTAFHSARWDHGHSLRGERVAVVGTGASAIQFIPEIAKDVARLTVFQRSAPYVIPKYDRAYPPPLRALFRAVPATQSLSRAVQFASFDARAPAFRNPRLMKPTQLQFERHLRKQVPDPELRAKLTPDYQLGCKRILISNDFYPTFCRDNVDLVTAPVVEVREDRVVDADGGEHEVDTIVFGTGFEAGRFLAPIEVIGRGGRALHDAWAGGAEAHLGITVAGFPNMFVLYGPNTNLGHNSILAMVERQLTYVMSALAKAGESGAHALEVREEAQRRFADEVHAELERGVWAAGCTSWYLTPGGKNTNNWPLSVKAYAKRTRVFDPAEHVLEGARDRHRGGSGEPLVLLHGLGSSRRVWEPVLPALEARHEVLALDLPGFGEAPPLPDGTVPSVPALADAVERAMDEAGFATAHIAGNSMGGWIALELARRGRARSVTALSPAGLGTRAENAFARSSLVNARAVSRRLAPSAERILRSPAMRKALQGQFSAHPERTDPAAAAYATRALAFSASFPAACDWLFSHRAEGLDEVACPVTIGWGTKDRLLLPRQAKRFAAAMPAADVRTLEGLGHVPMADDPDLIAALVLETTAAATPTDPDDLPTLETAFA